jgi:hypothetical protein
MTDEVLKELWDTKDNIAKEHGYSVDALAEYFHVGQDQLENPDSHIRAVCIARSVIAFSVCRRAHGTPHQLDGGRRERSFCYQSQQRGLEL